MKKLTPLLLSLVFAVSSFMTITAFAATSNQDGLDATLSFAKTEYAANEDIATTLTVKNNNSYTVKNVQTEITLPDGITLKSGSLTQEKFDLTANDSKVQELTLTKIVQVTKPSADDANIPQTGDNSHIGFVILMILSGGALLIIGIKQKKLHIKGTIPIVFSFVLVGTMLPMTALAASEQKSFTVEETVKIDGKDTTVKATVTYEFVQYSDVTVTNGTGTGLYAEGETVTITAGEAPEGEHFAGWTVEKGDVALADSNNSTTTFVMPAEDAEVKANFAINPYEIKATAGTNGTITASARLNAGDSKTFTMTANDGYGVKDVKVDGTSVGPVTSYTFENVNENHTIEVVFDKATTVSTAQDFRDAVTKDGIIVLANDITLDDNGDVEISKNVIIRGNGHTIFMPVYSGTNWSHPIITAKSGAVVSLECCNVSGNGTLNIWFGATMYIYNVVVDNIYCESSVYFDSGEISGDISINNATLVVLNDVKVSRESEFSFSNAREAFRHRGKEFWDICSIRGGTYYFDISDYLNPDLYKATQTKDANGVDIWVVTAK